jgi:hypothetical protein
MLVTLSEADRERLQCPENMVVKLGDITAREQATLQHAFRYDDTVAIGEAIDALFERDAAGELVRVRRNADLFLALAWLALRQSGVFTGRSRGEMTAELDGLDIQLNQVVLDADDDEKAAAQAEGKGESSTPSRTSTD